MSFPMPEGPAILRPNRADMLAHLTALFGEALNGLVEISWTESDTRNIRAAQMFDVGDLDAIADFAAKKNDEAGHNVYVGMCTRHDMAQADKRAGDKDYLATYAVSVDLDDEGAAEKATKAYGDINLRPTFAVITGQFPHVRAQLWWKLDGKLTNPKVHTEIQKGLAARFNGDPTITNPSRVMRLAGTIAWPKKPGRQAEMTAFRWASRADYPVERLVAVAHEATQSAATLAPEPRLSEGGLGLQEVGSDIDALLRDAQAAGRWHDSVLRLVAVLVGRGLPDSAILAMAEGLTQPGYTVSDTVADLEVMIRGARQKGYAPPPEAAPITEEEREEIKPLMFRPWAVIDPATIPRINYVYSDFYAAGYTSLTVAPPKVGKSLLALAEAVDIASGKGFLTGYATDPAPVVYYNAEDDQNVIDARVIAICQRYGIHQEEIAGRLHAVSGVEDDDFFLISGDRDCQINERLFVGMEKFAEQAGAAALIFDPLQDLSRSPETNEVFRLLGQRLRRFASSRGVAVGLVHHTRKMQPGAVATIEDARGGGALRGTSRFNRLLVGMTEDEAAKASIEDHRNFFRIGDVESNLAPPSSDRNRWFEKIATEIANGQSVPVIQKWAWPDAFAGVTPADARRVRAMVDAANPPPRMSAQANQWIGYLVADALELDATDKAVRERIKGLVRGWIKEDVLREETDRSPRDGRDVAIVICGANAVLRD